MLIWFFVREIGTFLLLCLCLMRGRPYLPQVSIHARMLLLIDSPVVHSEPRCFSLFTGVTPVVLQMSHAGMAASGRIVTCPAVLNWPNIC